MSKQFKLGNEYDHRRDEIEDEQGRCIALVWTRRAPGNASARAEFKDDPEGKENARYLVNAPAMYRALKMVQEDVNQMGCDCEVGDHSIEADCMVCAVNKVIADVEGRTNE